MLSFPLLHDVMVAVLVWVQHRTGVFSQNQLMCIFSLNSIRRLQRILQSILVLEGFSEFFSLFSSLFSSLCSYLHDMMAVWSSEPPNVPTPPDPCRQNSCPGLKSLPFSMLPRKVYSSLTDVMLSLYWALVVEI